MESLLILVGVFAMDDINGVSGLIQGNSYQLWIQIFAVVISAIYAFIVTYIILWIVNKFIKVRVPENIEESGLDTALLGEEAYR